MQNDLLNQAHVRESIAGEEDPGAALDVVRAMVGRNPDEAHSPHGVNAKINFSCSDGKENIAVDVVWPRHHAKEDVAKLLGLVMAHHGAIADTAWSLFAATGKSPMELEVDEDRTASSISIAEMREAKAGAVDDVPGGVFIDF